MSWIDQLKLVGFILQCQDEEGGIADRPGNMADIFHTFFGISGLSLLGYFDHKSAVDDITPYDYSHFRRIDPTYALPVDIVNALGLPAQKMQLTPK